MKFKSIKNSIQIPTIVNLIFSIVIISTIFSYNIHQNTKQQLVEKANIALKPIVLNSNVAVSGANIMKLKSKDTMTLYKASESLAIIIKGKSNKIPKSLFAPEQPPKDMEYIYTKKSSKIDINNFISKYKDIKNDHIFDNNLLVIKTNLKVNNGGEILAAFDASEIQTSLHNNIKTAIFLTLIIVILSYINMLIIVKNIVKNIKKLHLGVQNLLISKDRSSRVIVQSEDEIGDIADDFNKYLQSIEDSNNADKELIENVKDVVTLVKKGKVKQQVTKSTNNQSLSELKDLFNEMLDDLADKICGDITKLQVAIEKFQQLDFTHRIPNPTGKTSQGLNALADIINELLVSNKRHGIMLNDSSHKLLKNISILNTTSTTAATSLEETAASLEEITSNISNNTENVVKMASYANELAISAKTGENLAKETTFSMDEINEQVTAIRDTITVIDQIAFQTNILSLNAAVEAATAGEAGKGFAVVAQEVRNLATRSTEAAKEIKDLVENATSKTNQGKNIADKMISGYHSLNENISQTIKLIKNVEMASKEQQSGIIQINDSVNELDHQTQANANVAAQTQDIANTTSAIADKIVEDADEKEFIGKDNIDRRKNSIDSTYAGIEKREIEGRIKQMNSTSFISK